MLQGHLGSERTYPCHARSLVRHILLDKEKDEQFYSRRITVRGGHKLNQAPFYLSCILIRWFRLARGCQRPFVLTLMQDNECTRVDLTEIKQCSNCA